MRAYRPHLHPDDVAYLLGQIGVPGARHADHLGEAGRRAGHVPAVTFLVDDRRDAQAGVSGQIGLYPVGKQGGFGRFQAARARQPGDVPDALREQLVKGVVARQELEDPYAAHPQLDHLRHAGAHLGEFFLKRHTRKEIGHSSLGGQGGVAIRVGDLFCRVIHCLRSYSIWLPLQERLSHVGRGGSQAGAANHVSP